MTSSLLKAAAALVALVPLAVVACSGGGDSTSAPPATWPVDTVTGLRLAALGPVPALPDWPDAAVSDASASLGQAIFFDPRLSGSGHTACATCHLPYSDFQSGAPEDTPDLAYPSPGPTLTRNTPSLNNLVYARMARWDGSYFDGGVFGVAPLPFAEANMNTAQALAPGDVDGVTVAAAQQALAQRFTVKAPGYVGAFRAAYGVDITAMQPADVWSLTGEAIATFLRLAVSRDAPFDRWNGGDDAAMSASAVRGFALFQGDAHCSGCHGGPMFTDYQFHNVGFWPPRSDGGRADEGRYLVTGTPADRGAFLTPTLRSVDETAPYFHDGSQAQLRDVIRMKATPSIRNQDPSHDPAMDAIPALTSDQIDDLVSFLLALRGASIPEDQLTPPPSFP